MVAFGAIGIPIVVAGQLSVIDAMHISKIVGRQLPFLSIIVPLWLVVLMAGWKKAISAELSRPIRLSIVFLRSDQYNNKQAPPKGCEVNV